jgi:hypothetical protein
MRLVASLLKSSGMPNDSPERARRIAPLLDEIATFWDDWLRAVFGVSEREEIHEIVGYDS